MTREEFDALSNEERARVMRETDEVMRAHFAAASAEEIAALERMLANHRAGLRGDGSPL
jgi:hypothetical protein